jgi:uncharacterized protein (TIGR02246 family)
MPGDEKSISDLLAAWHSATLAGDLSKLLSLMDEDVVFLTAGQEPMRGREAFASAFQAALQRQRIDYTWETQEIRVVKDLAYCWNHLWVTVTALEGGAPSRRAGHTLTILRKKPDGAWVVFRDANMLTEERSAS